MPKYAIHVDDDEMRAFPLDNLNVIDVADEDIDDFIEMVDNNPTLDELVAQFGPLDHGVFAYTPD